MAQDTESTTPDPEIVSEAGSGEADGSGGLVLSRSLLPANLLLLPVPQRPVFPGMMLPMVINSPEVAGLVMHAVERKIRHLGIVLRRATPGGGAPPGTDEGEVSAPAPAASLHDWGTVVEIVQATRMGDEGPVQVMLRALERFRIVRVVSDDPHIVAEVEYHPEPQMDMNPELKAYALSIVKSLKELVQLDPMHKEELSLFMSQSNLNDPARLADFSAALTMASGEELQEILATVRIRPRIEKVLVLLTKEIELSRLQARISKQIEEKVTRQQREFFLREQLKVIRKELGLAKDPKEAEREAFEKRLEGLRLSDEAGGVIREELSKLSLLEPSSPEFNVTRNYVDWLTVLPWGVFTDDKTDIAAAERILNADHYGLEDVKERILEFLAVGIRQGNVAGSIICFVGPPGVGKTSLGHSIANSLGRQFYRFSVGGIQDEAEIKGHRRTYIGAMPGKFLQALKVCKSANPVIMLDEIDKIGASFRGDPASALLEVLDPEQNHAFLDHYLDVRFDLSNVFFICTANQTDSIPRALLDRMEVIPLPGYILEEKLQIAKRHLLPKQRKAHGLTAQQVRVGAPALREIIDGYAREAGVRSLEQHLRKIMRKTVRRLVGGSQDPVRIDAAAVESFLGLRQFSEDTLFGEPRVGVVTGLAYTTLGGDTLYIEAGKVRTGKAAFKQTGQLGEVMVESSEIAYAFIRSFLQERGLAPGFFEEHAVHIHVPAGATRKDGPSAGITMASALYSLATGQCVRSGLAMTGELTLTGLVMPIGGVKEKTIAAKRSGIRRLLFPQANQKDFDILPAHIRKGIVPAYARTFEDVVRVAFPPRTRARKQERDT